MVQWEYTILINATEVELQQAGKEGWELITVTTEKDFQGRFKTFYFKRKCEL